MLGWAREMDDMKSIRMNPVIVIAENDCFFMIYPF